MNTVFKKWNNRIGLAVFVVATLTYLSTMVRHISFWDTGEYIVSSAKLGVTHAPGAAFFQLLGAVWSGLAFGDGGTYPLLINAMSAICSGLTILFLFWIITHLSKKIIFRGHTNEINTTEKDSELTKNQLITIFSSATIGSLIFTFSDTFWFSAVEGEVYAMASMFTALIIWLGVKYDADKTERANKWLVLCAFVIGLSTGVHLMAMLAVPFVGYFVYAKNYKITPKSFLIANVIIAIVFGFIFKVIFPLTMTFFGKTEIFVVNEMGLPFNSGSILAAILLSAALYFGLKITREKSLEIVNTALLAVTFMLVGFMCWLVIPIRANANPHMNLNNPDTALGMLDYFNRVQYGDWPTIYGAAYTAHIENYGDGLTGEEVVGAEYKKDDYTGQYVRLADRKKYVYNKDHVQFFPKMYNSSPSVMENYANLYGFPEFELAPEYYGNEQVNQLFLDLQRKKETGELTVGELSKYAEVLKIKPPSFAQNLYYFMDFQLGYMFIRYFMWNFAGRQNDWEGHLEPTHGNWVSGIPFIDNARLGDQSLLPDEFKDNRANNVYFMLPLILGLIGFFFQLNKNFTLWWSVLALFLLTSVGIIFYTSVKPFEPRERDYALVTSFFAFAIWTGLGVQAIIHFVETKLKLKKAPIAIAALCLTVPVLMAFQNWDDHDRSQRTAAKDFAHNYLNALDKNAILFVYGDNDTYPLWGYQETELFRTDAKVVNFTLLGAPWYIEQARRKTYDAPGIPGSMKFEDYQISTNDAIRILSERELQGLTDLEGVDTAEIDPTFLQKLVKVRGLSLKPVMTAKEAMNFILGSNETKDLLYDLTDYERGSLNFLPARTIRIPVNKANALKYGIVSPEDKDKIVDFIDVNIGNSTLGKGELAMIDLFAHYNWDRPIYFSGGGLYDPNNIFYLNDYLQYQGMSYKLVPIRSTEEENDGYGRVDIPSLRRVFDEFKWGGFGNPEASFDVTSRAYTLSYRNLGYRLAKAYLRKGDKKSAKNVLDKLMKEIPMERFYFDSVLTKIASLYIELGEHKTGENILEFFREKTQQKIDFYHDLGEKRYSYTGVFKGAKTDLSIALYSELNAYREAGDTAMALSKFKEVYEPEEAKLKEIMLAREKNPQNPQIENDFANQTDRLQELFQIGFGLDSVYVEQKAAALFELVTGPEDYNEIDSMALEPEQE